MVANLDMTKEHCWRDLVCDRCGWEGHPTQSCRAQACEKCDRYHRGVSCDEWDTLLTVRDFAASKGSVQGVHDRLVKQLRDEKAGPGMSLNH
jgi:hypothetical protein